VDTGFQWIFPVCEAIRGTSWKLQSAGVMPAPYFISAGGGATVFLIHRSQFCNCLKNLAAYDFSSA
jgi:hypothetical protein